VQRLDAEVLAQQPLLGHHVVTDAHLREPGHRDPGVRAVGVVRRGRQAAAYLVDRDDKVALGVERVPGPYVRVAPDLVGARVPRHDQDRIVFGLVKLAPSRHRQLTIRDSAALFEVEPSDADQVVLAVVLV
jgi:hypothetical protein